MEQIKILVKNGDTFHELLIDKEEEKAIISYIKNIYTMKRKELTANIESYKGEIINGNGSNLKPENG